MELLGLSSGPFAKKEEASWGLRNRPFSNKERGPFSKQGVGWAGLNDFLNEISGRPAGRPAGIYINEN